MTGLIIVLLVSDGKNTETWDSRTVNIANHHRKWTVSVSTWIAVLNFIMGKALAVMFAEAVALSWWVDALKGQTLECLHFQWEVGQSVLKILLKRRFWGWVCVASIAFTAFSGLEALLQTASSPTTSLSSYNVSMTATLANALPAGFSGVIASWGHDAFSTEYYTPIFVQVLQDYTVQSPIHLDLEGCPSTPNAWCAINIPGVGFQYTCTAGQNRTDYGKYSAENPIGPESTLFQVDFQQGAWSILLRASWKDAPGSTGPVIANCNCTLTPALLEYPANVTQQTVTLESPTSTVTWTSNSTDIGNDTLSVDKVLQFLPMLDYDKSQEANSFPLPGSHSTLGGIGLALSRLFDSSISAQSDPTNFGARLSLQGSFIAPYAQFAQGTENTGIMNNTFSSPMDQLLTNIRDIMFRSSVAIAQHNITDYVLSNGPDRPNTEESQGSAVPAQPFIGPATYFIYETVYKTNKATLSVGIGLMLLAILAILPLYRGFWRLGRKVSMSPLEVAKALHYSTIITDSRTGSRETYSVLDAKGRSDRLPQLGSNFDDDELVALLGNVKVKYGEVAPHVLGMGLNEYTESARNGRLYH